MSNLIKGEFYKLRKSKYFIGMIILSIISSFYFVFSWFNDMTNRGQLGSVNGLDSISYSPMFIVYSSFLFALLGGEFISKDLKNGSISKSFSYGCKRNQVILSKLIVFILFSLFLEAIYTIILVTYVSINYSFCEGFNLSNILYLVISIVSGIMYNVASICIISMVAIITKSRFCTFISATIFWLGFLLYENAGLDVLIYMPWIAGRNAIGTIEFIPVAMISSFLTIIITIGVSMLYVKHEDIK